MTVSAAADRPESEPDSVCPACGGDGWYVGHEDECYDTGDCVCDGVQVQCECAATVSGGAAEQEPGVRGGKQR